ncbi:hypothetical protein M9Y10_003862 [Tritrichomonas musculus]|uniref:PIH1D1/2/3 CS-like domain-containing protein n=1 Tax=Tritrichomonas musculus TaxID=1915356 RepID=A0ABR2JRQ8_9EUKA
MNTKKQIRQYALNIHFLELDLPNNLITDDELIIKISSSTDHQKTIIKIPIEKIKFPHQVPSINVKLQNKQNLKKNKKDKIIFSFQSKAKRIAMSYIGHDDLPKVCNNDQNPKRNAICNKIQAFNIFQTSEEQKKEFYEARAKGFTDDFEISSKNTIKRKVIGQMKVQLSLHQTGSDINLETNEKKSLSAAKNNNKNTNEIRKLKNKILNFKPNNYYILFSE